MTGDVLTFSQNLVTTSCASCGIIFAVPEWWDAERRDNHKGFYCPNGHALSYHAKSDAEKEKERRIQAEARAARWEDKAEVAERRRRAEKAQKTRALNRIRNGVCPFCRRHFGNVEDHMRTEHADEHRQEVAASHG